jgi:hypothetical protein
MVAKKIWYFTGNFLRSHFFMNRFSLFWIGLAASLAGAAATANAASVSGQWNFLAGSFEEGPEGVARWVSPQGTALVTNYKRGTGTLRNSGAEGAGLRPDETASNKTVRAGVAVLRAEALNVRMAVFTGESVARLANRHDGGEQGFAETTGPAEGVITRVNGVAGAPLLKDEWVVFSFVLPSSVPLHNAVLLGDPVRDWRRGFVGSVASIVLIDGDDISKNMLAGAEKALARRFGVAGMPSATAAERNAAKSISGFSAHNAWSSLLLVR